MADHADQETQDAWKGILFTHAKVVRALEADLLASADLALTWLDVMNRLNEHPDRRLRFHELAERSLFTRSGLTRLVDRIEKAGYVEREHSSDDRRGVYVTLTNAGAAKLESLWPEFTASIQSHFGQHLNRGDIKALIAATDKITSLGDDDGTITPGAR
ncbi:MAG: MarR family winged helix-turn-helix transcriptional regulator [Acidimicrobiales bacterium]